MDIAVLEFMIVLALIMFGAFYSYVFWNWLKCMLKLEELDDFLDGRVLLATIMTICMTLFICMALFVMANGLMGVSV